MKRIAIPLFAVVLMASIARADDVKRFTCELDYPDGTMGVALVKVTVSGGDDMPTVTVAIEYFDEGYGENLGRYEGWSEPASYPKTEQEAAAFALKHFYDKK